MRLHLLALPVLVASTETFSAGTQVNDAERAELLAAAVIAHAFPAAPDGYTPTSVACPSTRPSIRPASGLSSGESNWLTTRRPNTLQPMRELLGRLNITGFDATSYINAHQNNVSALPNIGIAASGGGYRALMNGAGALAAMDSRTPGATGAGQIGGLLQSATYLAGLSGGSWLVGSLYTNNFTSVQSIVDDSQGSVWDFTNSILEGPSHGIQALTSVEYYAQLLSTVHGKSSAGYDTSLTDYWGRALSYQLVNATEGGPAYTWSSVQNNPDFANGMSPFPILIADGRAPGQVLIPGNSTIFEFNPFEMGSWDPTLYAMAPLQYTGSNFTGGILPANEPCIAGFDNVGFVMGTSSTLFNQIVLQFNSTVSANLLTDAIQSLLNEFGQSENDISDWNPNPFYMAPYGTGRYTQDQQLTLVDGGEDGENIPLHPLIQPVRDVDVIFAIDSSADTNYNWPNGTSLVATYQRSLNSSIQNGTEFPSIPAQNTFVNLGLNTRPTFFGCDATNSTNANVPGAVPGPLIVYLPNAPYSQFSNVSTFNLSYSDFARNTIIQNGFNVASRANGTVDSMWPTCVGCAIMQRSWVRTGTEIPAACNTCFTNYCWNGTVDNATPPPYNPTLRLAGTAAAATNGSGSGSTGTSSSASASGTARSGGSINAAGPRIVGTLAGAAACLAFVLV